MASGNRAAPRRKRNSGMTPDFSSLLGMESLFLRFSRRERKSVAFPSGNARTKPLARRQSDGNGKSSTGISYRYPYEGETKESVFGRKPGQVVVILVLILAKTVRLASSLQSPLLFFADVRARWHLSLLITLMMSITA